MLDAAITPAHRPDDDITSLKSEVGDRGMSTKIREIIKTYLAKRA